MNMRRKFLQSTGPTLPGMEISEQSEHTTSPQLILLPVAFPASPIALQESDELAQMSAIYGESSNVSFARLGPLGLWLKTYQDCYQARMDGSLEEFSETWPRAGMMLSGRCYQRRPLVHRISESESILLPTPT